MIMSKALFMSVLMSVAFIGSSSMVIDKSLSIESSRQSIESNRGSLPDDFRKDCTVKLDVKLSNGSTLTGELTFSDVTWWECTKMQVAAWWERNF